MERNKERAAMSNGTRPFEMKSALHVTAMLVSWCLLTSAPAGASPTPQQKCQAGKNKAAGKYAACLQSAEAKFVATGDTVKYDNAVDKCKLKIFGDPPGGGGRWQKLIDKATKAGVACPDAPLTGAQFQKVIDEHSDNITTALGGGGLDNCPIDLAECQNDLATCLASTLPADRVLKTGQAGCYDTAGNGISCTGTGQDGELQEGVGRSYTDNGDGTITDNQTGLMWEKKSDDGSIHDQDNAYTWNDAFGVFIAGLNTANFAGHNDWRLPNRFELDSLFDLGTQNPAVDAAFNTGCVASCTVTGCSCTASTAGYWSSTTVLPGVTQNYAWVLFFNFGFDNSSIKTDLNLVRAVRGGS
jgi:uncharacterized protein DUF1566